ncbi:MAG: DUF1127 domain-containing protein [Pseudorhodobacter sp.]
MTYEAFRSVEARRPLPPVARPAFALTAVLLAWDDRFRSRRALARLNERMLQDIGYTPEEAERESVRPFWKA